MRGEVCIQPPSVPAFEENVFGALLSAIASFTSICVVAITLVRVRARAAGRSGRGGGAVRGTDGAGCRRPKTNVKEKSCFFYLRAEGGVIGNNVENRPRLARTHIFHTHTHNANSAAPMLEFLSSRCIHIGRSVATRSSCPHIDAYCTAWRNRMRYSHHSSIVSPSESLTTPPTPLPPTFEPSATTALPTASAVKLLRASLSSSPASASHAGLPRCGQPAHR